MGIVTIILTFFAGITGFFEFMFNHQVIIEKFNIFIYLYSTVTMLGICLGILSTFVKRKRRRKILFYSSIITIILGGIAGQVIWASRNPVEITNPIWEPGLFIPALSNNLYLSFVTILSGPTIIYPYILLSAIVINLKLIAEFISFHGFKGVILLVGSFHTYPEFYAIYLAGVSGIRISLKSFKAYISIRRNGIKNTLKTIKEAMIHELKNTMPRIIILLIIAALLEEFWGPFWISYWLQHIA
jgi:hypothetical protein